MDNIAILYADKDAFDFNKEHTMQAYPSYGIILRNCSYYKNKVIVFDKHRGKIEGFPYRDGYNRCLQGSLVSYCAKAWRNNYTLYDIDLLELPEKWVMTDLLFLHHVLELISYFVQPEQNNDELFSLCKILYTPLCYEAHKELFFKKVFLCRLFIALGLYPEIVGQQDEMLFFLISASTDIMLDDQHHALLDKKMNLWLYICLQAHGVARLKTFDFLVKVGADETLYHTL